MIHRYQFEIDNHRYKLVLSGEQLAIYKDGDVLAVAVFRYHTIIACTDLLDPSLVKRIESVIRTAQNIL